MNPSSEREAPSDQAFEIVSAWLREQKEVANGTMLYRMCKFADFVIARAALSTQPQQAGWLPIDTAPKGSGPDGPSMTTHPDYIEPPKILLATAEGIVVGYYDWYYHEGYGRGAEPGVSAWRDHDGAQTYGATHWMPLPPVPGQEGGGE